MTARVLPFPRRPLAAQRRIVHLAAALVAIDEERASTHLALDRAELQARRLREDLEGLDAERRILERMRAMKFGRLDEEARRA